MSSLIRIIIADDHTVFRQGLKLLLGLRENMRIVAEVESADRLLPTVIAFPSDLLLLDLQMDRWVIEEIQPLSRVTQVVVLTASERVEDSLHALRMGARAIVQKRFAVETLAEAIRAVADGMVWIAPALQAELAAAGASETRRLTVREMDIVRWVASGLRNGEIAQRLGISEGTVKTHLNKIFQKLGIRDRVELTLYAMREHVAPIQSRKR